MCITISLIGWLLATFGFNPTDEGVVLSLSRRLLMGEIPHRDFISIRPVGSGILHIPELFFGNHYVFFISRLIVCFQFVVIALMAILLIEKASNFKTSISNKCLILLAAFLLSINSFPLMAWTTIDALFCVMIGTWLSTFENQYLKQFGYGIASYAILCKQNFLFIPFVLILLNRDYKNIGVWLFSILPILVYVELVYFSKSWNDAVMQLGVRTEIFETGLKAYYKQPFLWIGLGIGQLVFLLAKNEKLAWIKSAFSLILPATLLAALAFRNSYKAVFYFEFGIAAALFLVQSFQRKGIAEYLLFTLIIAWSTSISLGYNSPALAAGLLWIVLLGEIIIEKKWLTILLAFNLILVFVASFRLRTHFIYRDNDAMKLKSEIKLEGFAGIKTNANTASAMNELNTICTKIKHDNYCVITDYAAFWSTHSFNNPLPLDWTIYDEMPSKSLFNRCWKTIANNNKIKYVIAQKYETEFLKDSLVIVDAKDLNRTLIDSVRLHYIKKWEGKYFSVFTKPML